MISVFDMFTIGIGPSSSHTVGPMKAAKLFAEELQSLGHFELTDEIQVELFGSLGQTGKGHGTGTAVTLGLLGEEPQLCDTETVEDKLQQVSQSQQLNLLGKKLVNFTRKHSITYHRRKSLPGHANAMQIRAYHQQKLLFAKVYYSIGGGFILDEDEFKQGLIPINTTAITAPYPFSSGKELIEQCKNSGLSIAGLMLKNEQALQRHPNITDELWHIWQTMYASMQRGLKKEGLLPGGLKLRRRAPMLYRKLANEQAPHNDPLYSMDWVNLFAIAINEENAAGGTVVTAPTNGAAGVIPAVLCYYDKFIRPVDKEIAQRYLLTAAAIGILYKKNASISGAEVGCQGEVGVACSMAAAGLTEILGGTPDNVENAAEIGMEHNLGLTCDPVGGLVQVPCIERNAMGAIKAINASRLAFRGDGCHKVSLDKVIKTMWDTGMDMRSKYKETAKGGLAVNIVEC
ncbi:L-serine ammonia-lyase [Paraferrimonas sp. SM1919]|uniref:L-serine ammonia-lyase n=1 Tax=Paraferrimonas sp. SM1919 TaxID=2662263 RepID=UPI0013D6048B|nr:L-serine ammonia-lyase [Paraferrimonas sp. SM1919]